MYVPVHSSKDIDSERLSCEFESFPLVLSSFSRSLVSGSLKFSVGLIAPMVRLFRGWLRLKSKDGASGTGIGKNEMERRGRSPNLSFSDKRPLIVSQWTPEAEDSHRLHEPQNCPWQDINGPPKSNSAEISKYAYTLRFYHGDCHLAEASEENDLQMRKVNFK